MNQLDQSQLHALQAMMVFMPIFSLICAVIIIIPFWVIWKKAGFSPWLSLLMFIPMINIIPFWVIWKKRASHHG